MKRDAEPWTPGSVGYTPGKLWTWTNADAMMIVTFIWQKLISIEREVMLIATNFWQLFSRIFGQTLLIVTNIWRNPT